MRYFNGIFICPYSFLYVRWKKSYDLIKWLFYLGYGCFLWTLFLNKRPCISDNGWKSVKTRFYCMETRTECLHLLLFPIHGISVAVQTLFMPLVWCFMKCTLCIQSSINYCLKLWDFFPLLLCLLIKPYWYSYVLLQLVIMSCMEERGKHYSSISQKPCCTWTFFSGWSGWAVSQTLILHDSSVNVMMENCVNLISFTKNLHAR